MACNNKAFCDYCDARCPCFVIDQELWKKLCSEYNKWCNYKEVEGMSYLEAEKYIKYMPVFTEQ
jgi:hypothetical protein